MAARIVALTGLFTFLAVASAQSIDSEVANLNAALQTLRSVNHLPTLVARPNTSLVISDDAIPDEVVETFKQIQTSVFGKDSLIALKACNGCQAIADANAMSVNLEPNFLKSLSARFGADSKNIIAFVVAHEISHFTYEYLTVSANNHLSPNGNIPLLTKTFVDFVDLSKFTTMTPEEQRSETMKYLAMAGRAHSEVDLLGLLTLKEMNLQVSADAIKYLQYEVTRRTPEERAQTDFEIRLKTATEAVASGAL